MVPQIRYHNGILTASAKIIVDSDKDGVASVATEFIISLDAKEVINEIIKNEVPQWLKDILEKKSKQQTQEQNA